MPYKKKESIPGAVQFNKFIAELSEQKRENIKAQLNLEMEF